MAQHALGQQQQGFRPDHTCSCASMHALKSCAGQQAPGYTSVWQVAFGAGLVATTRRGGCWRCAECATTHAEGLHVHGLLAPVTGFLGHSLLCGVYV
jgi:hypothetical protein